jgi:hypothetical protein
MYSLPCIVHINVHCAQLLCNELDPLYFICNNSQRNFMSYQYRSTEVVIPEGAEIAPAFHPEIGAYREIAQIALSCISPWRSHQQKVFTARLPVRIYASSVELAPNEEPYWGVNPEHTAREPGLSPYIDLAEEDARDRTNAVTIELSGSFKQPALTRLYPGEYIPPLPWMRSARRVQGGVAACVSYWKHHAYIMRPGNPVDLNSQSPTWYSSP